MLGVPKLQLAYWRLEALVCRRTRTMVPPPVYIVPSYIILDRLGWIDTYAALIVPWLAHAFSIFLLRQHFKTIPDDLYDAAIIDGCSRLGFLFRVVVPLSKAVLITVALFTIVANWNSFLWPLIVLQTPDRYTLPVGLSLLRSEVGTDWPVVMAAACPTSSRAACSNA